jgi:hypothetical protein
MWGCRDYDDCRCLCISIEVNRKGGRVEVLMSMLKSPLLGSARVHIPGLLGLYPPP